MKKLTVRITAIFALLFILYSFLFSFNVNNIVVQTIQNETRESMLETSAAFRPSFRSVDLDDIESNTDEWRQVKSSLLPAVNPRERVNFYTPEGETVFSHGNASLRGMTLTEEPTEVKENGREFSLIGESQTESTYSEVELIRNSKGDHLGYLQVIRTISDTSAAQNELLVFSVITSIAAVIVLLIILYSYFHSLNIPLQAITKQLKALSNNDYSSHNRYEAVNIEEYDEIGWHLNAMANNLQLQTSQISMQEQRLNLLVDYLVIGVLLIDTKGEIQVANQAVYHILGIEDELEGTDYKDSVEGYRLIQMIENSFEENTSLNEEIYLYYPKEVIVDVNVVYVDDSIGDNVFGEQVIVLVYDITEIRRLEKVRSDFIANASHELKTPVTALQGFSETLLDGAIEDKETTLEFVKIMNKESNRLGALISDILDLAKIEQDQIVHKFEQINVDELVDEVFEHLMPSAKEKDIKFILENNTAEPIIFEGEHGHLVQVLTNLVSNAIKYNKVGGEVKVDLSILDDYIQISVIDNGLGIPKEDLPRVFERFYRVSKSRNTDSGGTGLGLSIVRNLVTAMNGNIDVLSEAGKGSEFRVFLPK